MQGVPHPGCRVPGHDDALERPGEEYSAQTKLQDKLDQRFGDKPPATMKQARYAARTSLTHRHELDVPLMNWCASCLPRAVLNIRLGGGPR